jgi:hypothetical protein
MYVPAGYNLTPGSMLGEGPAWSRETSSTRRDLPLQMIGRGIASGINNTGYVDNFNPLNIPRSPDRAPWEEYRNPFLGVSDFNWRIPPTFDPRDLYSR